MSGINNYLMGLGNLYRAQNPAEKRVATSAKVAENAGLAKPLIYAMMGSDMAEAEKWDTDQQATIAGAMESNKKLADQEAAHKVLGSIMKVSEYDPEEATALIQKAAQQYPTLGMYSSIKFTAKTKDDWMHVAGGDGQQYAISKTGLAWMAEHQDQVTDEIKAKYIVPIGGPSNKAPQSRTVNRGGIEVTEEWDSESKTWKEVAKGPRWKPGEGGGSDNENRKDYNRIESQINTLRGRLAGLKAKENHPDYDEDAIRESIKEINDMIKEKEYYLKTEYSGLYKKRTAGRTQQKPASPVKKNDPLGIRGDNTTARKLVPDGKGGFIYK